MSYEGHVENGVVVLDDPAPLTGEQARELLANTAKRPAKRKTQPKARTKAKRKPKFT